MMSPHSSVQSQDWDPSQLARHSATGSLANAGSQSYQNAHQSWQYSSAKCRWFSPSSSTGRFEQAARAAIAASRIQARTIARRYYAGAVRSSTGPAAGHGECCRADDAAQTAGPASQMHGSRRRRRFGNVEGVLTLLARRRTEVSEVAGDTGSLVAAWRPVAGDAPARRTRHGRAGRAQALLHTSFARAQEP